MEYVGYQPGVIHNTIHTTKFNHMNGTQIGFSTDVPTAEEEFHLYEVIWEPGVITGYVDGKLYSTIKYTSAFNQDVEHHEAFPFFNDFFMILNLAIGGDWGGAMGVDPALTEAMLEIDFVRVYQKDYNYYDEAKPSTPKNVNNPRALKNSIYWIESSDDLGVEYYNIYIDGELHTTSPLSQVTLKRLVKGQTYEVTVEAVDFTGKRSDLSEPFNYTFE